MFTGGQGAHAQMGGVHARACADGQWVLAGGQGVLMRMCGWEDRACMWSVCGGRRSVSVAQSCQGHSPVQVRGSGVRDPWSIG